MKKAFLASLAFATITLSAAAQQERRPDSMGRGNRPPMEGRMGGNNDQLVKELNLTPTQAEQWKKANEERKTKMDELRNNSGLSREEKREKMKAIMDEQKAKTDAFLTPEQKVKMEAARKKMMEERGNRPGPGAINEKTYDNDSRKLESAR